MSNLAEHVEEELKKTSLFLPFQRRYTVLLGLPLYLCGFHWLLGTFTTLEPDVNACSAQNDCNIIAASDPILCDDNGPTYTYLSKAESVIAEFDLICDKARWVTAMKTGFFFGFLLGVAIFSSLADTRGRRWSFVASLLVQILGAFLSTVAPFFEVYIFSRFLIGASCGGLILCAFVWNSEMVGPAARSVLPATTSALFALGPMGAAILAMFVKEWRHLSFVSLAIDLPFLAFSCWLLESPKWYAAAGRGLEAQAVLTRVSVTNEAPPPASLPQERRTRVSMASPSQPQSNVLKMLLCDERLQRRFLILCFTWFALAIGYFGLTMNVSNIGMNVYWATIVSSATELPVYFPLVPMLDSKLLGRRGTAMTGLLTGGMCCLFAAVAIGFFTAKDAQPSVLVLAVVFIGKAGVAMSFACIYLYAAELFPTDLRSRAMGMQSLCSRVGGMVAPVIADIGKKSQFLALLMFGMPALISGILLLFLPETRGTSIPENIEDIEPPSGLLQLGRPEAKQEDAELADPYRDSIELKGTVES